MQIEFQLGKQDFLTHQLFVASQSKAHRQKRILNWILPPVIYLGVGMFFSFNPNKSFFNTFLGLSGLWVILYPFYSHFLYKRHYARYIDENYKQRIGKKVRIRADEKSLKLIDEDGGEEGAGEINFSEIEQIAEISSHFFVRLQSGLSVILPKGSIGQEKLMGFIDYLKSKTSSKALNLPAWRWL